MVSDEVYIFGFLVFLLIYVSLGLIGLFCDVLCEEAGFGKIDFIVKSVIFLFLHIRSRGMLEDYYV